MSLSSKLTCKSSTLSNFDSNGLIQQNIITQRVFSAYKIEPYNHLNLQKVFWSEVFWSEKVNFKMMVFLEL